MNTVKRIFNSPEYAENYDCKARKSNWRGSAIMLELSRPYIHAGEKLLDLGIGTGLSSVLFHAAGLRIYGMDFSAEMLKMCRHRNISEELKEHDLREKPYPFANNSMDHVICGGVLHIFRDLTPIFEEVARIIRKNGTFAFTCADHEINAEIKHKYQGKNVTLYQHDLNTVKKSLEHCGFVLQESSEFFVTTADNKRQFRACLSIKK
ncbi:MAG: class I SAM-dependent methyltransferase [Victivallales bacterium]|nr:class I SAM-dependent methyltransferase [Victivallales bacterium]